MKNTPSDKKMSVRQSVDTRVVIEANFSLRDAFEQLYKVDGLDVPFKFFYDPYARYETVGMPNDYLIWCHLENELTDFETVKLQIFTLVAQVEADKENKHPPASTPTPNPARFSEAFAAPDPKPSSVSANASTLPLDINREKVSEISEYLNKSLDNRRKNKQLYLSEVAASISDGLVSISSSIPLTDSFQVAGDLTAEDYEFGELFSYMIGRENPPRNIIEVMTSINNTLEARVSSMPLRNSFKETKVNLREEVEEWAKGLGLEKLKKHYHLHPCFFAWFTNKSGGDITDTEAMEFFVQLRMRYVGRISPEPTLQQVISDNFNPKRNHVNVPYQFIYSHFAKKAPPENQQTVGGNTLKETSPLEDVRTQIFMLGIEKVKPMYGLSDDFFNQFTEKDGTHITAFSVFEFFTSVELIARKIKYGPIDPYFVVIMAMDKYAPRPELFDDIGRSGGNTGSSVAESPLAWEDRWELCRKGDLTVKDYELVNFVSYMDGIRRSTSLSAKMAWVNIVGLKDIQTILGVHADIFDRLYDPFGFALEYDVKVEMLAQIALAQVNLLEDTTGIHRIEDSVNMAVKAMGGRVKLGDRVPGRKTYSEAVEAGECKHGFDTMLRSNTTKIQAPSSSDPSPNMRASKWEECWYPTVSVPPMKQHNSALDAFISDLLINTHELEREASADPDNTIIAYKDFKPGFSFSIRPHSAGKGKQEQSVKHATDSHSGVLSGAISRQTSCVDNTFTNKEGISLRIPPSPFRLLTVPEALTICLGNLLPLKEPPVVQDVLIADLLKVPSEDLVELLAILAWDRFKQDFNTPVSYTVVKEYNPLLQWFSKLRDGGLIFNQTDVMCKIVAKSEHAAAVDSRLYHALTRDSTTLLRMYLELIGNPQNT